MAAKRTKKYVAALKATDEMGYPDMAELDDAEAVYEYLGDIDWFWDSSLGVWYHGGKADRPSPVAKIRVWADSSKVEGLAKAISLFLEANGFREISHSPPYKCRPPKHADSRVYIDFIPE